MMRAILRLMLLGLLVVTACGGSASPGSTVAAKPSTPPPPSPTVLQIHGSWHVTATTTKVSGALANKVGETSEREMLFGPTAGCTTPLTCPTTLHTVTTNGPAVLDVTYDGKKYGSLLALKVSCPGTTFNYLLNGTYSLTPTAGGVTAGVYRATAFTGTFVEEVKPELPQAVAQGCQGGHIEQDLVGNRTGA
jgi:hypothetical protein